jgi:hypothetical protein
MRKTRITFLVSTVVLVFILVAMSNKTTRIGEIDHEAERLSDFGFKGRILNGEDDDDEGGEDYSVPAPGERGAPPPLQGRVIGVHMYKDSSQAKGMMNSGPSSIMLCAALALLLFVLEF